MKSFQNKQNRPIKLLTGNCIHGRSSLRYLSCNSKTNPGKNIDITTMNNNFLNKRQDSVDKNSLQKQDQNTKMMRSLIALNENYFQDKLYIQNHGKPSKLKLKIPSFTGFTTYKKDYIKNVGAEQYQSQSGTHNFKESKTKVDFFDGTTYQNQFLGLQNKQDSSSQMLCLSNPKNNPKGDKLRNQAPTFNQSQYKRNFVNWGAGSHMPSMKPQPNPAVTNLPFNPHTVYSSEFTKKKNIKKQNFNTSNVCSFNISGNYGKGQGSTKGDENQHQLPQNYGNASALLYLTTNDLYFDKKNNSKENSLKPKVQSLGIDGGVFKGKTEYQSQFIKQHGVEDKGHPKKTLGQLQNLILNL